MNFQNDFNKLNNKIQEVFKNWDKNPSTPATAYG